MDRIFEIKVAHSPDDRMLISGTSIIDTSCPIWVSDSPADMQEDWFRRLVRTISVFLGRRLLTGGATMFKVLMSLVVQQLFPMIVEPKF